MINIVHVEQYGHKYWMLDKNFNESEWPLEKHCQGRYFNKKLHRIDGPAYIGADGRQQYFVNGNRYWDNKSFQEAAKISDEEMMIVILKYGNVT